MIGEIVMDNKLSVNTVNGGKIDIIVLDIVEGLYNNIAKKYIVYCLDNNSDDIMISILNETNDSFSLDTIDDNDEFQYIQNLLLEMSKGDVDESE